MPVDPDYDSINMAKRMISYDKFATVNQKAEEFLSNFKGTVDIVYLDGYDYSSSENHHSETRKAKYLKYFGTSIQNHKCYQMHLDTAKLIHERIKLGGLICINDVNSVADFQHKGRTAIPYLIWTGCYQIVDSGYGAILLQRRRDITKDIKLINPALKPKNGGIPDPKKRYIVTLLGYTNATQKHTNWFPWNRFLDVYKKMGYETEWCELGNLTGRIREVDPHPRIFICWNQPTCIELIQSGVIHSYDVILQKLTSLGKGMDNVNWGSDPKRYFSTWNWPIYQTVEFLLEKGFNIYGFGCHSHSEEFPEKDRIVKKLTQLGRLFWINWGSTAFSYEEIQNCKPAMDNLQIDIAYVGSKWGQAGRGNTDQWDAYIQPILGERPGIKSSFHGAGFQGGMISDDSMKVILKTSKVCPILHAPSWVAERGIQDRFYTVFTAGRFGVVDNPGVYDFFDEDEVVCETDPVKYRELTKYFMDHPEKQLPYILKVQHKIRTKYNLYVEWDNILTRIITDQIKYQALDNYDFLLNVTSVHEIKEGFYQKKL